MGDLVLKSNAHRIVLFEPFLGGIGSREYLEVVNIADLFFNISVDPDCRDWFLLSLRFSNACLCGQD